MATNFEFYKDEILKAVKHGSQLAVKDNKPVRCMGLECKECDFKGLYGKCNPKRFGWLYAEHTELPKLTKRERAFCEAAQTGWIARDENGELYWFAEGFEVDKLQRTWNSAEYSKISTMGLCFCFVKWEDEKPWSIEDLLKLEVIEVQEDA